MNITSDLQPKNTILPADYHKFFFNVFYFANFIFQVRGDMPLGTRD
jgi:hypothetical protein